MLLIDDREPSEFVALLIKNCPIPIEFRRLPTGDYQIEDVILERKEINDFAGSITGVKKRLFNQADRLKKFKHPYIVISGRICDIKSHVNPHAILGAIAYLAARGITVVSVDTDEELAYLILKIFEKSGKLHLENGWFKK